MSAPVLSDAECKAMESVPLLFGQSEQLRESTWLACREWAEERAESLGEDEWHTDGDGRVIGGAPPDSVFVARCVYSAALGRERALREALAELVRLRDLKAKEPLAYAAGGSIAKELAWQAARAALSYTPPNDREGPQPKLRALRDLRDHRTTPPEGS